MRDKTVLSRHFSFFLNYSLFVFNEYHFSFFGIYIFY